MPVISPSSKVLVTGGSGFIGSWIVKELLERGFQVRTTVRSQAKVESLKELFKDHAAQLEFVIVEDVANPGAFDEVVKGIDGIIHTAAPMPNYDHPVEPSYFLDPAMKGSIGILESAKCCLSVKRVVLTSSVGALWEPKDLPYKYTEDDWNETAVKTVEKEGKETPGFLKYCAAKVLAEQTAWKWVADQSPAFDLVTILPSFTWGPIIAETNSTITGSMARLLTPLMNSEQENYKEDKLLGEWQGVDVRDVAKAHVDVLLHPSAGGQRFIISAQTVTIQHIYDILNANPIKGLQIPIGNPEILQGWTPKLIFSGKKSVDTLGMHYRGVEGTIHKAVERALEMGWRQ